MPSVSNINEERPWTLTFMSKPSSAGLGDTNSPGFETEECLRMRQRSAVCRDLRQGTQHMKSRLGAYIPRYEFESEQDYANRLALSSFRNFYGKAAASIVGKIFSKPPALGNDVPERIKEECENADLNGNDWTIVAENYFNHALDEGISWMLVDYHNVENAGDLTIEQEEELGVRPYWVTIPQHRVLGVDYEKNGNVYTITMFRYWAWEKVRSGAYGYEYVFRVYVYTPYAVHVFERQDDGNSDAKDVQYTEVSVRNNTLGMVPVVELNLDQVGPFEAKPPLEDLAEMNIEHLQIRSDQRRALAVMSWPVLAIMGATVDSKPNMGPMQAYVFEDPKANMKWVESTGVHLAAGRTEIKDLEDAIRNFALSFETPGMYATATAVNVDASDAVAPIIRWAYRMRDALAQVLHFHAKWLRLNSGGSVNVDTSFIKSMLTLEALKVLLEAYKEGSLTRETFLTRLQEYGLLSDKFDAGQEVAELERQMQAMQSRLDEARRGQGDEEIGGEPDSMEGQ